MKKKTEETIWKIPTDKQKNFILAGAKDYFNEILLAVIASASIFLFLIFVLYFFLIHNGSDWKSASGIFYLCFLLIGYVIYYGYLSINHNYIKNGTYVVVEGKFTEKASTCTGVKNYHNKYYVTITDENGNQIEGLVSTNAYHQADANTTFVMVAVGTSDPKKLVQSTDISFNKIYGFISKN